MFNTSKQAARHTVQQAAAFGLAALVTLSILGSINQMATTPAANSFMAQAQTQVRA